MDTETTRQDRGRADTKLDQAHADTRPSRPASMDIEIVYPTTTPQQRHRAWFINWAKWPFLAAAYACPILNLALGWPAWSVVVLWSLWILWSFTLSPALVELNRISQAVKLVVDAVILLVLIDWLLAPGWAAEVVPIVSFGALIVVGVLFFTDFRRQRQNMAPMLVLAVLCLVMGVGGLAFWGGQPKWPLIVLSSLAGALIIATILVPGASLIREAKKRFHI